MYLDSPIRVIERRIRGGLEIIIEILERIRNDLTGLELVGGWDWRRQDVGLRRAPPSIG